MPAVSSPARTDAPQDPAFPAARPQARKPRRRLSSWFAVFLAILLVTAATLTGVYLGGRQLLLADLHERAAADVREQLDDFLAYADNGTDPNTAADFGSSTRLLDVYLSSRIPGPEEAFAGFVDGHLIQMDRGESTRRLTPDSPLIGEIATSGRATGTVVEDDNPAVHWGKVHLTSPEDSRPAVFLVVRYTGAEHAQLDSILGQLRLLGLAGLGVALPVSVVLALWLGRRSHGSTTQTDATAAAESRAHADERAYADQRAYADETAATEEPAPPRQGRNPEPGSAASSSHHVPTASYRRTLALTSGRLDEQISRLSPQAGGNPALQEHLARLRYLSDSLTSLAGVFDPQSVGGRVRVDPGELTWQLAQRLRHGSGRELQLTSTATGHVVEVDPEQLYVALDAALRDFMTPRETGNGGHTDERTEFGTAFRGAVGNRMLSLWIRHHRRAADAEPHRPGTDSVPATGVPPITQAVAELHGGRAWMNDGCALGVIIDIDVPARGDGRASPATSDRA